MILMLFAVISLIACNGCDPINPPTTTFTVTLTGDSHVAIVPYGVILVEEGRDDFKVSIKAQTGYSIDKLIVDGVEVTPDTVYLFSKITSNHTLYVTTKKIINKVTISATSKGNGTITPTTLDIEKGSNATLTITPNAGYNVDTLKVNDVLVTLPSKEYFLNGNTYTLSNVTVDTKVYVSFKKYYYNIYTYAEANGTISPNGVTSVKENGSLNVSIIATDGYMIDNVIVDGKTLTSITQPQNWYSFYEVKADHEVKATFKKVDVYWYAISAPWYRDSVYIYDKYEKVWDKYADNGNNEVIYFQTDWKLIAYWDGKLVGILNWSIDYTTNPPTLKKDGEQVVSIDEKKMIWINNGKDIYTIYSHH